jgi:hypothetical protein
MTGPGSTTLNSIMNRKTKGKEVCVAYGDTCPGHITMTNIKLKFWFFSLHFDKFRIKIRGSPQDEKPDPHQSVCGSTTLPVRGLSYSNNRVLVRTDILIAVTVNKTQYQTVTAQILETSDSDLYSFDTDPDPDQHFRLNTLMTKIEKKIKFFLDQKLQFTYP